MIKCRSADQYQAKFPPRCNLSEPCDVCAHKWEVEERLRALEKQVTDDQRWHKD